MSVPTQRMSLGAGLSASYSYQTPNRLGSYANGFVSTDTIAASVWAGDSTTALCTPAVAWGGTAANGTVYTAATGAPITLWTITLAAADAGALSPGTYRLRVTATHGTATAWLWDGLLDVAGSPGTGTISGLITLTYAEQALSRFRLSRAERDFLPSIIQAASDGVRKWCGQRDFTRTTYAEEHVAELNGYIALRQYPCNSIGRIRGYPQTVLTARADNSVNQQAWINYPTTGDWASGNLTFTGIVLNTVASGVTTATPLLFATYPTIGALASAIAAVSSWSSYTTPVYALYPTTDLSPPGGVTAQGAMDESGVEFRAYTEDLALCRVDNKSGMVWVGRRRVGTAYGPRWGEDYEVLEDLGGGPVGRVQVTYDAGFATIPSPLQMATAELVKAIVERLRTDHQLMSESIGGQGNRFYQVASDLVGFLPKPVLQAISLYRRIGAR